MVGIRSVYLKLKGVWVLDQWMIFFKLCLRNLRTQRSLWENFMWNKYCKKQIPTLEQWKGGSKVWKHMLENRILFSRTCGMNIKKDHLMLGFILGLILVLCISTRLNYKGVIHWMILIFF